MGVYLTAAEYLAAPTAVDTNALVYGGDAADQLAELTTIIAQASGWLDQLTSGGLVAASSVSVHRVRYQRDGSLSVHPNRVPLNELLAVSTGWSANTLSPLADLSGVYVNEEQWVIPSFSGVWYPQSLGDARGKILAKLTSVSGWPNTTIAAPTIVGATSVSVADGSGFVPALGSKCSDQTITIYDGVRTETVNVTSRVGKVLTVAPLTFAHAAGIAISGLPADIKKAATMATSAFIQDRQTDALAMSQAQMAPGASPINAAAASLRGQVVRMLDGYGRIR